MYDKRVKIFIAISLALLAVCVLRLAQMQLFASSEVQNEIAELKRQKSRSTQLKTVRGRVLDRNGNVLAANMPRFQVCIDYGLTSYLDDRVVKARLEAAAKEDPNPSLVKVYTEIEAKRSQINEVVIPGCVKFGLTEQQARDKIRAINDQMWDLRAFFAWRNDKPDPNLLRKYNNRFESVPTERRSRTSPAGFPTQRAVSANRRHRQSPRDERARAAVRAQDRRGRVRRPDRIHAHPDVNILPAGYRHYPYGAVASQTIGWVGPVSLDRDKELFANDRLARYRPMSWAAARTASNMSARASSAAAGAK